LIRGVTSLKDGFSSDLTPSLQLARFRVFSTSFQVGGVGWNDLGQITGTLLVGEIFMEYLQL
jgi:hypothetical protein